MSFPRSSSITTTAGTIATGGTAQTLSAANSNRKGLGLYNNSAGVLSIDLGGGTPSATFGIIVPVGSLWECPQALLPSNKVTIFGATTSQAYTLIEA